MRNEFVVGRAIRHCLRRQSCGHKRAFWLCHLEWLPWLRNGPEVCFATVRVNRQCLSQVAPCHDVAHACLAPIAHESECAAMPSHLRDPRLTRRLARHVVRPSKSRTSSFVACKKSLYHWLAPWNTVGIRARTGSRQPLHQCSRTSQAVQRGPRRSVASGAPRSAPVLPRTESLRSPFRSPRVLRCDPRVPGPGPLASIAQFALAQGTPLAGGDGADRVLIQPQGAYYIVVQHSNAAGGDSAHSQLVVPRYTEPTDEKHNERCRQCRGYLIGYGHPSTGQRQRFTRIRDELRGEASARIAPVSNPC